MKVWIGFVFLFYDVLLCTGALDTGMLFPRESPSRTIQELNGMWNFRADMSLTRDEGFKQGWYKQPLKATGPVLSMPVPSSFNDIMTDKSLRDFVGWVWYDRQFYVSSQWKAINRRVVLRFDSAHYYAMVWVNGNKNDEALMVHEGGHLPFEAEIHNLIEFGSINNVTIAINNTLTPTTLPPGTIKYMKDDKRYPPNYFVQNLQFDFFNYAGIHRRVRIYTTPQMFVDDITIVTSRSQTSGLVDYTVATSKEPTSILIEILDMDGNVVAQREGVHSHNVMLLSGGRYAVSGSLTVPNAHLWYPYTMSQSDFGYMYTLKVKVGDQSGEDEDIYLQPFGIRTVTSTNSQILLNGLKFYCHGVAKHEDSDIRGKGLDFALIARDFAMMKWMGVNCFRTSHYPYAEEILEEADRQGIVVIDESPGVGITHKENFGQKSLQHHLEVMEEMVRRDKNHPSVLIWSVANEPASNLVEADNYFKTVINHTRTLDPTRLVTFVTAQDFSNDVAAKYTDVQCINRYYGWYSDTGHLDVIWYQLGFDLENWHRILNKPLIITEYGADTVPGLHMMPSYVFTEDYQVEFLEAYHQVFDRYRTSYLAGEMVWNFADFMTAETDTRVVGNKKGLLTRQRQPKAAAHTIRQRYLNLTNQASSHQDHNLYYVPLH